MNLTQEIESRIQRFVSELNELVRRQALQAVSSALGTDGLRSLGQPARRGPGRPPGSGRGPGRPPGSGSGSGSAVRVAPRRKGEKRTAAQLAALERALFDHVRSHPGQGIEAIGKAIGLPTSELARPMKKLVTTRQIKTQGQKRATKYSAADGATGPSEGGSGRGAKRGAKRGRRKAAGRKRAAKKR